MGKGGILRYSPLFMRSAERLIRPRALAAVRPAGPPPTMRTS